MSSADETSSTNKNDNNKILNSATEANYESLIYQMMDKGEVDTYK